MGRQSPPDVLKRLGAHRRIAHCIGDCWRGPGSAGAAGYPCLWQPARIPSSVSACGHGSGNGSFCCLAGALDHAADAHPTEWVGRAR